MTAATAQSIQYLTLAYFGRPSDPAALNAWPATGKTLEEITAIFVKTAEYESNTLTPNSTTSTAGTSTVNTTSLINTYYQRLFGRLAAAEEVSGWTTALATGAVNVDYLGVTMMQAGLNLEGSSDAAAAGMYGVLKAKFDSCQLYSGYLYNDSEANAAYSTSTAITSATTFIAEVTTSTAATSTAAQAAVSSMSTESAVGGGQTYALTTSVDTFVGTTGNDTFIADDTGAAVVASAADSLDGGAGDDTLNIYSPGAAPAQPKLTSIEAVNIYDLDANLNINNSNFASATSLSFIRGDGAKDYTFGANVATITLKDIVVAGADVGLIDGTAEKTSLTLNLNGITDSGGGSGDDIDLTGAKLETIVVNTTGTASDTGDLDVAAATSVTINADEKLTLTDVSTTAASGGTLTITGDSAVSLGTFDVGFDTVTASGSTGGLTGAVGAAVDTVITGSSGDDVITASTTDAIANSDALAVAAGDGTADVLVITEIEDVNTAADGARYTGFEIIRTGDSNNTQDMSLVGGVTALQITGGTAHTFEKLSATQAGNITFSGNNVTSTTFTLTTSSGSSDTLTVDLKSDTAATNVDVIGIAAANVEIVNIKASTGTDATLSDFGFLANSADAVNDINITGTADVEFNQVANTLDVVAVDIDASGLTGTAHFVFDSAMGLVTGSSITGTGNADSIDISSTTGSTYNSGAGNDTFQGSLADLVATGADDNKINAGDGTEDKITLDDTTTTLTDNHFTYMTGMEQLALSNTVGDLVLTTGAGFNAAFASGVTITSGTLAATKDADINAGLYNGGMDITIDGSLLTGAATDNVDIVTGGGADKITLSTDDTWVGVAGAQGSIVISSGAGDDEISWGAGNLLVGTTSQFASITGGTGADKITVTGAKDNSTNATSVAHYNVAAGDSLVASYDTITGTGFEVADGTNMSDGLNFAGVAVGTLGTSTDSGTIASHSITAGVVIFDDASTYATALVINSDNLSDAIGYLNANANTNGTFGFLFDSTGNGTADSTMVFNNGTTVATDSLVLLDGLTGVDAIITTNGTGADDLFVF